MKRDRSRFFGVKALAVLVLSFPVLAWAGGPPAWAQPPGPEPEASLLHLDGVVSVQDLPRVGPRVPIHREMPFQVPDLQQLLETKARHQARTQPAPLANAQVSTSTVAASPGFIGLRLSESGGYVPPDTQIGVGPSDLVEAVNLEMRIWQKGNPVQLLQTSSLCDFFGVSRSALSDPKVRFDPVSQRWFIAAITFNNSFTAGAWRLAVSATADPTGLFVRYTASTGKSAPDFPAVGISNDKVVRAANAFRGNSFLGTELLAINKADLVAGTSAAATYFLPPQGLFTIQPALELPDAAEGFRPGSQPHALRPIGRVGQYDFHGVLLAYGAGQ